MEATVKLPDGRKATLKVPDGMSESDIQAQVSAMYERGDFGQRDYREGMRGAVIGQSEESQPKSWREKADDLIPDPLSEFAAAANREVTELIDFLGPDAVNNVLSLMGSERRAPTLTGSLGQDGLNTGIEGGFMEPGLARDAVQTAGRLTSAAGGFKSVPRHADKLGSVVADFVGAGSSTLTNPIRNAAPYIEDLYQRAMPQNPLQAGARRRAELPLKRRSGDASTIGFDLDPRTGEVVRDPRQGRARTQGMDERVVTMVRDAPKKAREKFRQMLDIVERSKTDALYESQVRPGDIVGESITTRTKALTAANRQAGRQLDKVARNLKGQPVDVQPAVKGFLDDIESMGIQFDPASGSVSYAGSDIEDLDGPIRAVNRMLKRLYNSGKSPDAYDVHRMKRWIDEQVSYGKSQEGLSGRAAGVMKSLRHNLDGILDSSFPEYNRVNTVYSDTIGALNALQDAAGKRIDISGPNSETALGTLSRRILGNVVSRQDLANSLGQVDEVTQRLLTGDYAGTAVVPYRADDLSKASGVSLEDLDDSLVGQIRFVSELESLFGTNAKNSFLGDISKGIDRGAESAVVEGGSGFVRETARGAYRAARGINEENAMKALRELLRD